MFKYLVIAAVPVSIALWCLYSRIARRKLQTVYNKAFPAHWNEILLNNVPVYVRLPEELKRRLNGLINVFLKEKKFYGCDGLQVTDEMRVTIAAQACLLYLNREGYGYRKLKTILLYPAAYTADQLGHEGGIATTKISLRAGESWVGGPIVLSWDDTKKGAANFNDGKNVVIHEFAHKLDEESPGMDGLPVLNHQSHYQAWAKVLGREFERHRRRVAKGQKTVVDAYGASAPAEYFAVLTEHYFEQPEKLKETRPELFEQLRLFYRINPIDWNTN